MSQQPKTETDRLANVIQVLQLGQKTGRLVVERNEGPRFEQGIITFVNGQVVQAITNQRHGADALHWLKSWGTCRFTFTPEPQKGTSGRLSTLPPQALGWGETDYTTQGNITSPLPHTGGPLYPPQPRSRTTGNLGGNRNRIPTAWLATPYRTRHIEDGLHLIEQMGLSRAHRRLFLLIDGGRTVRELVRLMAQEPEAVQKLLQDLERAGVIHT